MNRRLFRNLAFSICITFISVISIGCQSMWYVALDMIVDIVPERFSFTQNDQEISIPIVTSLPLDDTDQEIQHLIIMVHGAGLNAGKSYQQGIQVAKKLRKSENKTMIVAPQFLEGVNADEKGVLFWDRTWRSGGLSLSEKVNQSLPRVSSFTVMDKLITHITKRHPDIRQVSILGHSAGGQFIDRYAAINNIHQKLEKRGISLLYVVANPSSYLYLDAKRYFMDSEGVIQAQPTEALKSCQGYNQYKYGLDSLYGYAKTLSKQRISQRLRILTVLYVLGAEDRERSWSLDTSCEAELQGQNRFERGLLYQHHLKSLIPEIRDPEAHWVVIPGVGHDANEIFGHKIFIEKLQSPSL